MVLLCIAVKLVSVSAEQVTKAQWELSEKLTEGIEICDGIQKPTCDLSQVGLAFTLKSDRIVGNFLGDIDIVSVILLETCSCDAYKLILFKI